MENTQQHATFYMVVTVSESLVDTPNYRPLYEECFTLISATSEEEAREKAQQLAAEPQRYNNVYGEEVTWVRKRIVDVRPLLYEGDLRDGAELYARYFRNYDAYEAFLINDEE